MKKRRVHILPRTGLLESLYRSNTFLDEEIPQTISWIAEITASVQGRILQTFIRSFIPFLSAVIILKRIEFTWYWIVLCPIEMAVCYLKQYNYSLCNEEITSWFFIHKWILTIKYALCFLLLLEERKSTCTNATFKSKPSCWWFLKFHFLPFKKPEMDPHRLHQQGVKGAGRMGHIYFAGLVIYSLL